MPRSIATLQYLPAPDALVTSPEGITLVINDGSDLTPALCAQLTAKGHQLAVMTWQTATKKTNQSLPDGVTEYVLTDCQEATIQAALSQLPNLVSQFIYLHPRFTDAVGVQAFVTPSEKAFLKAAFRFAKHLKGSLNQEGWQGRSAFLTVIRQDGAFGSSNSGRDAILGGSLFGLTKSLNAEWPSVFCRAVDLCPQLEATEAAEKICGELYDSNRCLIQTAYNAEGKRFTWVTEPVAPFNDAPLSATINSNSVFLVTGGSRGITATCVKQLATVFRSKFILLGRTELFSDEPAWAHGLSDSAGLKRQAMETLKAMGEKPLPRAIDRMVSDVLAQREIRANLASLQTLGVTAFYRNVDITDQEAVKAVLDQLTPLTGPITGLIHGAGRLADKRIEHKTEADFEAVFDVKVQGLESMMQAVSVVDLRHVVLFSSVAGFYGNAGQTDYAMANEVLNRFAYLFRKNCPQAQVVSVNWGAWDSGMVSPVLEKRLLEQQVALIPSTEGPLALIDQLSLQASEQVQVILGGGLPVAKAVMTSPLQTYTIHRTLTLEENPFLEHHVIQGYAVLPVNLANVWLAQTAQNLYPGFHFYREENVKLFKGIVFDGRQPTDYKSVVQEKRKGPDQIELLVTILSHQSGQRPVPRYQAQIQLVSQRPKPTVESLPPIHHTVPLLTDASVFYEDGTLFHGADFQGVKQVIAMNEQEALLLCEHPGLAPERQGQFPVTTLNGFLSDIMHQGLMIWVRRFYGCACLPLGVDCVELTQEFQFGQPFYVSIQIVKATDYMMEANLVAFHALTGDVLLKSQGASVTISPHLQWTRSEPTPIQ